MPGSAAFAGAATRGSSSSRTGRPCPTCVEPRAPSRQGRFPRRWFRATASPDPGRLRSNRCPALRRGQGRVRALFDCTRFPRTLRRLASCSRRRPRREPSTRLSRLHRHAPFGARRGGRKDASIRPLQDRPVSTSTRSNRPMSPALQRRRKPRLTALLPLRPAFLAAPPGHPRPAPGCPGAARCPCPIRVARRLDHSAPLGAAGSAPPARRCQPYRGRERPPLTPTCRARRAEGDPSAGRTHPCGRARRERRHRRDLPPRQRGPARSALGAFRRRALLPPCSRRRFDGAFHRSPRCDHRGVRLVRRLHLPLPVGGGRLRPPRRRRLSPAWRDGHTPLDGFCYRGRFASTTTDRSTPASRREVTLATR